ncbi:ABC1 family protein, partial [Ostertagia ostertagi]
MENHSWLATGTNVMSILHTKTKRKRYFRDCDQVLDEVFGEGFAKNHKNEVFVRMEPYSIGSGCIAQVYKATVNVAALERVTGKKFPQFDGFEEREVAIKVADYGVDDKINLDLSILRNATSLVLTLMPSLSYLEPLSALAQFEMVLRRQVDLRNEARALQVKILSWRISIIKKTGVKFPTVIGYTKNIIVESFEHGMYINRLVAEDKDPELATRQSPKVRRRIALLGARALLKMIFVDYWVSFNEDDQGLPGVHSAPPKETIVAHALERIRDWLGWRSSPRIRFTDSPELADEPTLVMLDTGIVVSETEKNFAEFKSAFPSNITETVAETKKKQGKNDHKPTCGTTLSKKYLNISALLSEMFSLVAAHRVYLDSSFTSVVLSVMVLEGFGRSLDPDLDLFQCARPYLLNMV